MSLFFFSCWKYSRGFHRRILLKREQYYLECVNSIPKKKCNLCRIKSFSIFLDNIPPSFLTRLSIIFRNIVDCLLGLIKMDPRGACLHLVRGCFLNVAKIVHTLKGFHIPPLLLPRPTKKIFRKSLLAKMGENRPEHTLDSRKKS